MTATEKLCGKAIDAMREYRVPLWTSLIVGLATYTFMLTNKLPSWDDLGYFFSKGGELSSGRWGLTILSIFFPDFSMPWLWGIVTLFLVAIFSCVTIRIFEIENKLLQVLLTGLIQSAPALISLFAYMFTSSVYAVGILCSGLAVYFLLQGGKKQTLLALALAVGTLSIYQAYFAVIASFLLLRVFQAQIRREETPKESVQRGMRYVLFLLSAAVIYAAITFALLYATGTSFSSYATQNLDKANGSILNYLLFAYIHFFGYLGFGLQGVNATLAAQIANITAAVISVGLLARFCVKERNAGRTVLLFLCVVLLPIATDCMVFIAGLHGVSTLTSFAFISVYVLLCMLIETMAAEKPRFIWDVLTVLMAVIISSNVFSANRAYLSLHMAYENKYAMCESIATQVMQTPGFDEHTKLAIFGLLEDGNPALEPLYPDNRIVSNRLAGIDIPMLHVNLEKFLAYYIGFNIEFAVGEEKKAIEADPRYAAMPVYPYYGSVQKIGDVIVVKLN